MVSSPEKLPMFWRVLCIMRSEEECLLMEMHSFMSIRSRRQENPPNGKIGLRRHVVRQMLHVYFVPSAAMSFSSEMRVSTAELDEYPLQSCCISVLQLKLM